MTKLSGLPLDSESWTANDLVRYPPGYSGLWISLVDGGVLKLLLTQNSIRIGRVKLF